MDKIKMCSLYWEYEDMLPEMGDYEYSVIFDKSEVRDGVRMFPFVKIWNPTTLEHEKYYLA